MTKPYFRDEIFILFGEWATEKFGICQGLYIPIPRDAEKDTLYRHLGVMTSQYAEFVMDMRDGRIIKCRCPELLLVNTIEAWTNMNNCPTVTNPQFPWG